MMDKIRPDVSVFTNVPNNGYMAIIFTEDGVMMSADCKKTDVYRGLLEVTAQFLLDSVDDARPEAGAEDNDEDVDKYARMIAAIYDTFCDDLQKGMTRGCTKRQLTANGVPEPFASMLAAGIQKFPGKFERVDNSDCDEKKEDDSDDAYNLD